MFLRKKISRKFKGCAISRKESEQNDNEIGKTFSQQTKNWNAGQNTRKKERNCK
jgi:hypothetical protein